MVACVVTWCRGLSFQEDTERTQIHVLAVQAITSLVLSAMTVPVAGNPAVSCLEQQPRNKPLKALDTRFTRKALCLQGRPRWEQGGARVPFPLLPELKTETPCRGCRYKVAWWLRPDDSGIQCLGQIPKELIEHLRRACRREPPTEGVGTGLGGACVSLRQSWGSLVVFTLRFGGTRCSMTFVLNFRFGRKLSIIRGIVEQEIQAMVSKRENIATHHLYQAWDPVPSLSPATTGTCGERAGCPWGLRGGWVECGCQPMPWAGGHSWTVPAPRRGPRRARPPELSSGLPEGCRLGSRLVRGY